MYSASESCPDPDVTPCTRAEAEAGDATAQFGLGVYLAAGAAPDYVQALALYLKAAEQDHAMAQLNAGRMFAAGQGTKPDDDAAVMWIRRAADSGDAGAQFEMGDRYSRACARTDTDSSESRVECYKWFKLAAAQGYLGAEGRGDFATLRMTAEEVREGERRANAFPKASRVA